MYIPPHLKRKSWRRFFVGVFFGTVISYCIFIFMYGAMYEKLLDKNLQLQARVTELTSHNEALLADYKNLDEQTKKKIKVESIEVEISNEKQLLLDRLIIHQLQEAIKKEINHILGQDIEIVAQSDQLLASTIENKIFTVDDFSYRFEVRKLIISKKIRIIVKGKMP